MTLQDEYAFRSLLVQALTTDLVGPASETETITEAPITRYICGILYPQAEEADGESARVDPEKDHDVPDDYDEVTLPDPPIAMAHVRYPSSIGLSFAVDTHATKTVRVMANAGLYEALPSGHSRKTRDRRGRSDAVPWRRKPIHIDPQSVEVDRPSTGQFTHASGLGLYWRVRTANPNGVVAVTVALINTLHKSGADRDASAFFQPEIVVDAPDATHVVFSERARADRGEADEDLRLYQLLYRSAVTYSVGHGCGVEWNMAERGGRIWTTATPSGAVALSQSNPAIRLPCLDMAFLASAPAKSLVEALALLPDGYADWIAAREAELAGLPPNLRRTAETNVALCRDALRRIRLGIDLLGRDGRALEAFQLSNKAMRDQRARSRWFIEGRPGPGPDDAKSQTWYPFQLAFILLCIAGIAEPSIADRDMADLLWFPTGGGKTEAYLGLIAFVVFLRRLRRGNSGEGVTALMRYTLRLLTIQQFERASILICACEAIRESRKDLGEDPISIGLWVGQGATPNDLKTARLSLDKLRTNPVLEKANPVQLHMCPRCGAPLDHRNYYIAADNSRLVIDCRNKACLFNGGLPIYVVDDDIYKYQPTLLVATADKFASLPWREQARKLFNVESGKPPPELIIQDELHLISGPLGTLAGLYETAIDLMCSEGNVRPKLVASTATIRRAGEQSRALFDRRVSQFPPPGLDAGDSYFARDAPDTEKGNRLYVGLMAPGTSQTTLLVQTYAALLQRAADLPGDATARDPYWTLVGYFNSLRVLSGARIQVQDDVGDRMGLLAGTGSQRPIDNLIELTSRESSGAIPNHLKKMGLSIPNPDALDVILATNMISVGVDINRLGLMVMMGQPQSTSEYIQATSRVGRQHAGLVVTLFNSARSRDRSHYESFVGYHAALYRQVESTSVTPFSPRARDRALHAVLIAIARLTIPQLRSDASASLVAGHLPALAGVKEKIMARVRAVAPDEAAATSTQIDALIDAWVWRASTTKGLTYRNGRQPELALLTDAADDGESDALRTLWSLRDVDKSSNLYQVT